MKEITIEELRGMPKNSYMLIDIRDEGLVSYGTIPGAVNFPLDESEEDFSKRIEELPKEKKLVFYCQIGRRSRELDDLACIEGRETFSLQGGYIGYIRSRAANETNLEERQLKAEDSIRRKYHEQLFTPFARACKTYQLISEGDRIAVYNKIRGLNLGLCRQSEPSDYRKVFCCSDPEATGASPVFGTHRGIARMPTCDRAFAHPPVTALLQSFFTRSTHSPYSAVVYMSKFSS